MFYVYRQSWKSINAGISWFIASKYSYIDKINVEVLFWQNHPLSTLRIPFLLKYLGHFMRCHQDNGFIDDELLCFIEFLCLSIIHFGKFFNVSNVKQRLDQKCNIQSRDYLKHNLTLQRLLIEIYFINCLSTLFKLCVFSPSTKMESAIFIVYCCYYIVLLWFIMFIMYLWFMKLCIFR